MKNLLIALVLIVCPVCLAQEDGGTTEEREEALAATERVLKDEKSRQALHQHFSAECLNLCRTLMDQKTRTQAEVEDMVLQANASLWHWKQRDDCKPVNLSIAYCQLGRVNCLAGDADLAKHYGERCIRVSLDGELSAFYLGYGYEVMANASLLGNDAPSAGRYLELAEAQLAKVKDEEEKERLEVDLSRLRERLEH